MTEFIAEIGGNHHGSLDHAIELIYAASNAGATGVKFQAYDPGLMVLDSEYMLKDGPWKGRNLRELYFKNATPFSWFPRLFEEARLEGLEPFASVFDEQALMMLEDVGCRWYKIASFELVDIPLLRKVAMTGKTIILSTGMADYAEIQAAVYAVREVGCIGLTLLHCVSTYPAPPEDARLGNIPDMKRNWSCHVGLSDHTLGPDAAVLATVLGAGMIEKHFTLDRGKGGDDAAFSVEPLEFAEMVHLCSEKTPLHYPLLHAPVGYGPTPSEAPSLKLRRSLYFTEPLMDGTVIEPWHVATARPALGFSPARLLEIMGKKVVGEVYRGTPVTEASVQLRG